MPELDKMNHANYHVKEESVKEPVVEAKPEPTPEPKLVMKPRKKEGTKRRLFKKI